MLRALSFAGSLLLLLIASSTVMGQESWPTYPLDGHNLPRGSGDYLSWVKLLLLLLVYFVWVKTTDWVNCDAQLLKLNYLLWNPINFFPFLAVFLIIALSVSFAAGYTILVLSWIGPLGVYIYQRNSSCEDYEKVLTPDHLRHLAAVAGKKMGMKIDTEKKAPHERGAPVTFNSLSGKSEAKNQANMVMARQSEGFVPAKELIADAIDHRGDKIMMDFEKDTVTTRYQIDGVWHEAEAQERETGDLVLHVFKTLANANPEERRQRQSGEYAIEYKDQKYKANLVTQGTKAGERAIVHIYQKGLAFPSLTEAGMRTKMQEQLKELLQRKNGVFLFTSVPGGGLSTTMALTEKMCDRYMRDFISYQDVTKPEPVAENIEIESYDPARDKVKDKLVSLFRKEPDVLIVHELVDQAIVELICERTAEDKLVMTSIRAKEAVEALLRVLLLKVPAKVFAPVAIGVLNQRLIRKLCEECKEEYTPSADLLKKLGIPAGRVDTLYRPPQTDEDQPVCTHCGGLGYRDRTSIFELLTVDDTLRDALIKQPKLEVLRKVAKKAGNLSLQEEGVVLVAQGITSVNELSRVLKQ